jgi:tartrate-resistant acid phosphatase type 5
MLSRRTLILFILIAFLGVSIFSCTTSLPMLLSSLWKKNTTKTVVNQKPIPPFSTISFKDSASVRFLVVGDWGTGASLQKRIAEQMCVKSSSEQPSFIISTGDNIYNRGVDSINDPQWKTKFEDIYSCDALRLPWYAILGNHDHRGNIQAQIDYHTKNPRWNMPARYYTFRQSTADGTTIEFFAIDTDPIITGQQEFVLEQERWLRKQLGASQATWKVVIGHHMIRSHGGYGDQQVMIDHIKPLLDEYCVDLYMNGHDHDLQFLKAPNDKFYCLISGSGGEGRDTGYGENTIFAMTNGGFNYIAVSKAQMYIEFVNNEGKTLFATSILKQTLKG